MRLTHLAALALIVGAACRGSSSTDEPRLSSEGVSAAREKAALDTLDLRLEAPLEIASGEPVPIVLHLRNIAGRPLELSLRGRVIAFDITVTDSAGTVIWRRLEGEVIPAILRLEVLPAGGSLDLDAVWDQRTRHGRQVAPGGYYMTGEVLTDAQPLRTPATPFVILPSGGQ